MGNVIEDVLAEAENAVKADVTAAVKAHPNYDQIVAQLAEKAVTQLIALIA